MDRALLSLRLPGVDLASALDVRTLRRGAALAFAFGVAAGLMHARALGLF